MSHFQKCSPLLGLRLVFKDTGGCNPFTKSINCLISSCTCLISKVTRLSMVSIFPCNFLNKVSMPGSIQDKSSNPKPFSGSLGGLLLFVFDFCLVIGEFVFPNTCCCLDLFVGGETYSSKFDAVEISNEVTVAQGPKFIGRDVSLTLRIPGVRPLSSLQLQVALSCTTGTTEAEFPEPWELLLTLVLSVT